MKLDQCKVLCLGWDQPMHDATWVGIGRGAALQRNPQETAMDHSQDCHQQSYDVPVSMPSPDTAFREAWKC